MIGIDYDKKYKIWMVYDVRFCECHNHLFKTMIRGDTAENIILELQKLMEKVNANNKNE